MPKAGLGATARLDKANLVISQEPHAVSATDLLTVDVRPVCGVVLEPNLEWNILVAGADQRDLDVHRADRLVADLFMAAVFAPDEKLCGGKFHLTICGWLFAADGEQPAPDERRG